MAILVYRQRQCLHHVEKVIGVDVNQFAVDTINQGKIHIVEPDLDMIVNAAVTEGYLKTVTRPEPADAFLIAVPTPFLHVKEIYQLQIFLIFNQRLKQLLPF